MIPQNTGLVLRSHESPLPKTEDDILAFVKKVIALPNVVEMRMTATTITVRRNVAPDEEVLPDDVKKDDGLDVDFLLRTIELEHYPFEPAEHPFHVFANALKKLNSRGLHATHIVTQDAELFAAWLNLPWLPTGQGDRVMGLRIVFNPSEALAEKLLFVGSANNTGFLTDAVLGIIVDMGV